MDITERVIRKPAKELTLDSADLCVADQWDLNDITDKLGLKRWHKAWLKNVYTSKNTTLFVCAMKYCARYHIDDQGIKHENKEIRVPIQSLPGDYIQEQKYMQVPYNVFGAFRNKWVTLKSYFEYDYDDWFDQQLKEATEPIK